MQTGFGYGSMKKASIVSIGNELLSGQTIDTNIGYLGRELLSIGVPVVSSYTVGDEIGAIVRALKLAGDDADVILATGGLGPTDDDVTRQAFAEFLGAELEMQKELLEQIREFFAQRGLEMPEKNRVQAYIPLAAKALANNLGTAPGIMAKADTKVFVAMPGVPSEMKQMFCESVLPDIRQLAPAQAVVVRKARCCGAGESTIAEMLGDLMQRGRNPLINCTAESGIIWATLEPPFSRTPSSRKERFLTCRRITVNNCILAYASVGFQATVIGEIIENYNALFTLGTSRTNTDTGANSNAYPPLLKPPKLLADFQILPLIFRCIPTITSPWKNPCIWFP